MKKVLLVFFMAVSAIVLLASTSFAAGTGNLVIHFHTWDDDYTDLGGYVWGGLTEKTIYDGTDDFGVYFEYNGLAVEETGTYGFIATHYPGGVNNWDKATGDVTIEKSVVV